MHKKCIETSEQEWSGNNSMYSMSIMPSMFAVRGGELNYVLFG